MTTPKVKCRCHDTEVESNQVEMGVDVFRVRCREDATVNALHGDPEAIQLYIAQNSSNLLSELIESNSTNIQTTGGEFPDFFTSPQAVFSSYFYVDSCDGK